MLKSMFLNPTSKASKIWLDMFVWHSKRLEKLDWLDEKSIKEAINKLNAVTVRIGYPDVWRDYSSLKFDAKNPITNEQLIARANWGYQRSLY
ncbi:Peptidase family M13 [Chryseobacterium indologenes]|nr:hypothetical protein [Chryseobacterium indologenes]VFA44110.1 Peptidase family M13 [Chryseobacterium indologenes]